MSLFGDMKPERAAELLSELSYDQLCALLLAKASMDGKRCNIRTRPGENHVLVVKKRSTVRKTS